MADCHVITAPLQCIGRHGVKAELPQLVHRFGFGHQVTPQAYCLALWVFEGLARRCAAVEHCDRGRRFPVQAFVCGVSPVHQRHGHTVTTGPKRPIGFHAQQAITTRQRLQGQARTELARDNWSRRPN